ncbi:hypothetical protein KW791_03340 [Candidatus Parcubacteria bacterium]|nr:hypothetical protein [Candidatus Parcubacteria bacterium]
MASSLVCTGCNFDNFPFTNENVGVRMVTHCHQCHCLIATQCALCRHLHPIGTTYCSLYGANISAFKNKEVQVESLLAAFLHREEVQAIAKQAQKSFKYWTKKSLILAVLSLVIAYFYSSTIPIVTSAIILSLVPLLWLGYESTSEERIRHLWNKEAKVPGITFPVNAMKGTVGYNENWYRVRDWIVLMLQNDLPKA